MCPAKTIRIATFLVVLILSGCATAPGSRQSNDGALKTLGLDSAGLRDAFSPQMREMKSLVNAGKMGEAERHLAKEVSYFTARLADATDELPGELQKLGEYIWGKYYSARTAAAVQTLIAITNVLDTQQWSEQSRNVTLARSIAEQLSRDRAVQLLRLRQTQIAALRVELARVEALAATARQQALALTFEYVLTSGKHSPVYVGKPFDTSDYLESIKFQERAIQAQAAARDREELAASSERLAPYLSGSSREAVDQRYGEMIRAEMLADGRVTLDELSRVPDLKTPFGGGRSALEGVVRIGYLDLTSATLKDRNIYDFEIAFKQDLSLAATAADMTILRDANWAGYDYVFVTDLAAAKVSRTFQSRKSVKSRAQTGERQESNPAYVQALSAYQQAMSEYQSAQFRSAIPRACYGWGCVIQGLASGLAQGAAKSGVDEASQALSRTSQTLTIPVYSDYTYQSVDITTTKSADVNYYIIDIKGKQILRNNFQVNDQESFNVAYNVRDEDPEKASILRNVKTEDEVAAWEKRQMEVRLSTLFGAQGLQGAASEPLTGVDAFLASIGSRRAVGASPTYVETSATPESRPVTTKAAHTNTGLAHGLAASQTIADERFDSVVVIQNAGSIGTGFFVTPELVLTAYHVVKDHALVQMMFYDGTKTYGRVVAHDIRLDLALVRAQTAGKPLKIHAGPLRLGETVEAIGHPKGYEFTITRGVISAMRRQRSAEIGSNVLVEFVQTDTPISPGNSGGPLLLRDVVVGVNDWIRVDKGSQNLNFSVSYNEIRSFLQRFNGK